MKHLFLILLTFVCFSGIHLGCKKKKDNTPPPNQSYRIKSTTDGSDKKTFSYDNENRLTRIDFAGGSFRIVYSNVEIKAQVYFANGNPDPSWKYLFTIHNGHINGGFKYLPNGGIGRDYRYEYDIDGRLQLSIMRVYDFTGDVSEVHRYDFSYDAQNNLQQVGYTRGNQTGTGIQKADSISSIISYYNDRNFIKWKQTGFDFFGKASGGIRLTGLEIVPFSFLFQENIIPSEKALQTLDSKKYQWNTTTQLWNQVSTANQTWPSGDYTYNNEGLPVKFKNITLEWEAYE